MSDFKTFLKKMFIDEAKPALERYSGSGGGSGEGLIEVTELPEVGKENVVYKLVSKPTFNIYANVEGLGIVDFVEYGTQQGMTVELVDVVDSKDQLPTDNIKVSNGDTVIYFYYVRNDDLYLYGPFGADGNTWMGMSMRMPFGGEITSVDEITVTNTLYILVSGGKDSYYVYEKQQKAVPNTGTLSEIYFNTDLSVEEAESELRKLTLNDEGLYYILASPDPTKKQIFVTYDEDGVVIMDYWENVYIFNSNQNNANNLGFIGWNTSVLENGKYSLGAEVTLLNGDPLTQTLIGNQNSKIANVVRVFENKWTKISGANIVSKGGTAVPNNGLVKKVYINPIYTAEEMRAIIEKYAIVELQGLYGYPIAYDVNTYSLLAMVYTEAGFHAISVLTYDGSSYNLDQNNTLYYENPETHEAVFNENGLELNWTSSTVLNQYDIGYLNKNLIHIISATPSFGDDKVIKELNGNYEAVELEVTENTTIDLEQMLNEGKLPLKIVVKIT